MSRLGFANIYELLDESDSSGVETGRKAQEALDKKNAATAAALVPVAKPAQPQTTGKFAGERRQGGNNDSRGPRQPRQEGDRPPRQPRQEGDRPPRQEGDRPPRQPRQEGDRPPRQPRQGGDRPPRRPRNENAAPAEGGDAEAQTGAEGASRPFVPRGQRGGPRPDRGYERRQPGDQDQRPRREYDRHSATGRGKEVSKGGAGKANWGSLEDETHATVEGSVSEVLAAQDVKEEVKEDAAAPAAQEAEVDNEPPVRTLDDYLSEKKKAAAARESAAANIRRAGEGEDAGASKGFVPFAREETSLFAVDRSGKDKKSKESKDAAEKKVSADQVLKFQDKERAGREDRRGSSRGGRGGFQGRGRGAGGAAPNFGDQSAFPTLSQKA